MMFHLADFEPFLRSTVNKSPVILLTDKLDESFYLLANRALFCSSSEKQLPVL